MEVEIELSRIARKLEEEDAERCRLFAENLIAAAASDDAKCKRPISRDEAIVPPQPEPNGAPKSLLTGWKAITAALKMKYGLRDDIKRLNQTRQGPIINHGKGTSPMVYRENLLAWWDTLALAHQALSNESAGAKLSAEAQYNYGRNGTAAPEIAGGVKNRRNDRQA